MHNFPEACDHCHGKNVLYKLEWETYWNMQWRDYTKMYAIDARTLSKAWYLLMRCLWFQLRISFYEPLSRGQFLYALLNCYDNELWMEQNWMTMGERDFKHTLTCPRSSCTTAEKRVGHTENPSRHSTLYETSIAPIWKSQYTLEVRNS